MNKKITVLIVAALVGAITLGVYAAEPGSWGRGRSFQYYETINFDTSNLAADAEATLFTIESGNVVESSLIEVSVANGDQTTSTITLDIGGVAYDSDQAITTAGGFPNASIKYISTDAAVTLDGDVALTSGVLNVWVKGYTPTKPGQ